MEPPLEELHAAVVELRHPPSRRAISLGPGTPIFGKPLETIEAVQLRLGVRQLVGPKTHAPPFADAELQVQDTPLPDVIRHDVEDVFPALDDQREAEVMVGEPATELDVVDDPFEAVDGPTREF